MCLYQVQNDRTTETGKLCVKDLEFVDVTDVIGDFSANGILGLAPSHSEKSIVTQLMRQKKISQEVVGLNFEDPSNTREISKVSFGAIDTNEIVGGEQGLRYYSNVAMGKWGLLITNINYDSCKVSDFSAQIAMIDSGNTSIQLPATIYDKVVDGMKKKEGTIV